MTFKIIIKSMPYPIIIKLDNPSLVITCAREKSTSDNKNLKYIHAILFIVGLITSTLCAFIGWGSRDLNPSSKPLFQQNMANAKAHMPSSFVNPRLWTKDLANLPFSHQNDK